MRTNTRGCSEGPDDSCTETLLGQPQQEAVHRIVIYRFSPKLTVAYKTTQLALYFQLCTLELMGVDINVLPFHPLLKRVM